MVSILFAIVPEYGNEYTTKEDKNWTCFKNFAPKLNLNHNIYDVNTWIWCIRTPDYNECEWSLETFSDT